MATVIRCDRTECLRVAPVGNMPSGWVASDRLLYCSPRCATLALGGVWPDDPVPSAYEAALAGTPVDASLVSDRPLRLEVLEATMRGDVDRIAAEAAAQQPEEPDPEPDPEPEDPPTDPEPEV